MFRLSGRARPKLDISEEEIRAVCTKKAFLQSHYYLSSPKLSKATIHDNTLSAEVAGHYGTYRTTVTVEHGRISSTCTCADGTSFCKHAAALALTWIRSPRSFLSLEEVASELSGKTNDQLKQILLNLITKDPSILSTLRER